MPVAALADTAPVVVAIVTCGLASVLRMAPEKRPQFRDLPALPPARAGTSRWKVLRGGRVATQARKAGAHEAVVKAVSALATSDRARRDALGGTDR
mmetsp:Transcript_111711/g.203035  ORF Transcript_111711/g.203035 Transcript_111711/m.203035 type:complete len:96 (+) Transcript_111711:77-364(+)